MKRQDLMKIALLAFCLSMTCALWAGCNEWTTNGPYGGSVMALAMDPQNPATLYAGIWGGGVYKTTDGGESWRAINNGLETFYIKAIAVDPHDSAVVYATGDGDYSEGVASIYKSSDGGESWSPSSEGIPYDGANCIVVDPLSSGTLYVGTAAVFKSTDGGATWEAAKNGLPYYSGTNHLAIDQAMPNRIYAWTCEGLYKTTDGANSWTFASTGLPSDCRNGVVVIDPLSPSTLYTGTYGAGLFKSSDGGGSWSAIDTLPPYITSLAVDPHSEGGLYAGTEGWGVFRSCDGGETWAQINDGITDIFYPVHGFAIDPLAPGTLYAGIGGGYPDSGGGVFRSGDGGSSWRPATKGILHLSLESVVADPAAPGTLYASSWDSGVFKSYDGGGSWELLESLPRYRGNYDLAMDPLDHLTVYSASNGGVYKTTNGGLTWEFFENGSSAHFTCLAAAPGSQPALYAGSLFDGAFKSIDGGVAWSKINKGLPPDQDNFIITISIDPLAPSILYAGSFLNLGSDIGLFKSTDGGDSWISKPDGVKQFPPVWAIGVNPENDSVIYAAAPGHGLFKSTDGASSLAVVEGAPVYGTALVIDAIAPETLYLGSGAEGVFKTRDGGLSWNALINGLPIYMDINALAVCHARRESNPSVNLIAATDGGVYILNQVQVPGDCNEDGAVSIAEVQNAINMFFSIIPPGCGVDTDGDVQVSIGEVQTVLNGFLGLVNPCS